MLIFSINYGIIILKTMVFFECHQYLLNLPEALNHEQKKRNSQDSTQYKDKIPHSKTICVERSGVHLFSYGSYER